MRRRRCSAPQSAAWGTESRWRGRRLQGQEQRRLCGRGWSWGVNQGKKEGALKREGQRGVPEGAAEACALDHAS